MAIPAVDGVASYFNAPAYVVSATSTCHPATLSYSSVTVRSTTHAHAELHDRIFIFSVSYGHTMFISTRFNEPKTRLFKIMVTLSGVETSSVGVLMQQE